MSSPNISANLGDDHRILNSLRAGDKICFLPLLRQRKITDIITNIQITGEGKLQIFTFGGESVYNNFAVEGSKLYHSLDSPLTIAGTVLGTLPLEIMPNMRAVETLPYKKKQQASIEKAWADSVNDSNCSPEPNETEAKKEEKKKSSKIIMEARALMAGDTEDDLRSHFKIYQGNQYLKILEPSFSCFPISYYSPNFSTEICAL